MTSARKRFTNRLNAMRRSTGPKTSAGKARSSRNALRHGLTLSLQLCGGYPPQIESLARAIAGKNADARQFHIACRIAAVQLNLLQVRQIRHCLLSAAARERKSGDRFCEIIARLGPLDTYEQRALAGRRLAIREFDSMRPEEESTTRMEEPPNFGKGSEH